MIKDVYMNLNENLNRIRQMMGVSLFESETPMDELDHNSFHNDENLEMLRNAIDRNKMVSVVFVKKDGSVKVMVIRKNLSSYVPSERERTDAQINVEANFNQKKVVDMNAYNRELRHIKTENPEMEIEMAKQMAAKKSWRTINLETVLGFQVDGQFIDLRDENDIMNKFGEDVYNSITPSMRRAGENNPEEEVENP